MGKSLQPVVTPANKNKLKRALDLTDDNNDRTIDNEDIREGCRGGRANFTWDTVKADRHRNMYLGNSIKANIWRSARPSNWYEKSDFRGSSARDGGDGVNVSKTTETDKTIDGDKTHEKEDLEEVKREEALIRRITLKYGFVALSELEKYKEMLRREDDEAERRRARAIENQVDNKPKQRMDLKEELKRERELLRQNHLRS